jgi:hypothetical protein
MRPLLALLALLATPAAAQEPAQQFAAAAHAFFLPGTESLALSDAIKDGAILATLPDLEGGWMPATDLFRHAEGYSEGLLSDACGRIGWSLEQTAPRSFALRRTATRGGAAVSLAVRYDWMTGNTFDRGVDENDLLAFMDFDATGEVPAMHLLAANMRGHAMLFHPSPDILVIVAPGMPAEILMRCPA